MICIHCGHKQEIGNFCGKCGAAFPTKDSENEVPLLRSRQADKPNPYLQNIKTQTKQYTRYFKMYLKTPTQLYMKNEQEFFNGIISIILFATLTALSFFTLINSTSAIDRFFSTFGGIFIFGCLSMGLVIFTLTLINHFFGPQQSFKSVTSLYGGHLPAMILLLFISLLLILVKSFLLGSILLLITFLFTVFLIPLNIMSLLLKKQSSSGDPFYGFIIYVVTISILFTIFITLLADSTIGNTLNHLGFWF